VSDFAQERIHAQETTGGKTGHQQLNYASLKADQHRLSNPLSMSNYPEVKTSEKAGNYPVTAHAGEGYVWDAVLEYRV
jgi:hypothetical protein